MDREALETLMNCSTFDKHELLEINETMLEAPLTGEEFSETWDLYRDVETRKRQ